MIEPAIEPKTGFPHAAAARVRRRALLLASLLLPALAAAADAPSSGPAAPPTTGTRASQAPRAGATGGALTIELHKGIPGIAFIGQTLRELRAKFPAAQLIPFAGQHDVASVRIPEAGISCQVAGTPPEEFRVVSVGFNLSGTYESFAEGNFRTDRGIARGSTVNDLLGAYGRPSRIKARRPPGQEGQPPGPGDPEPSHYVYDNVDGSVATDFVVEGTSVARVVVNDLAPLRKYLLKGRPEE